MACFRVPGSLEILYEIIALAICFASCETSDESNFKHCLLNGPVDSAAHQVKTGSTGD